MADDPKTCRYPSLHEGGTALSNPRNNNARKNSYYYNEFNPKFI